MATFLFLIPDNLFWPSEKAKGKMRLPERGCAQPQRTGTGNVFSNVRKPWLE
jgi:hypothetical protein